MTNSIKTILVTGGAGYIGSVLTGLLLARGYTVRVLDKLTFGGTSLLPHLPSPNFEFVKGDICREPDVLTALSGIDAVVHLAAIVGDPACAKFPDEAKRTNKDGSELLSRLAIENGVERFVFASTCSNYGKMDDPDGFVDESSPLRPVSLYAELKVGFEKHLMNLVPAGLHPGDSQIRHRLWPLAPPALRSDCKRIHPRSRPGQKTRNLRRTVLATLLPHDRSLAGNHCRSRSRFHQSRQESVQRGGYIARITRRKHWSR